MSSASVSVTRPERSSLRTAGTAFTLVRSRTASTLPTSDSPATRCPDSATCSSATQPLYWPTRIPWSKPRTCTCDTSAGPGTGRVMDSPTVPCPTIVVRRTAAVPPPAKSTPIAPGLVPASTVRLSTRVPSPGVAVRRTALGACGSPNPGAPSASRITVASRFSPYSRSGASRAASAPRTRYVPAGRYSGRPGLADRAACSAAVSSACPSPSAWYAALTSTTASAGYRSSGLSSAVGAAGAGAEEPGLAAADAATLRCLTPGPLAPAPATQATASPPTRLTTVSVATAMVSDDGRNPVMRSLWRCGGTRRSRAPAPHPTQPSLRSHVVLFGSESTKSEIS